MDEGLAAGPLGLIEKGIGVREMLRDVVLAVVFCLVLQVGFDAYRRLVWRSEKRATEPAFEYTAEKFLEYVGKTPVEF